MTPPATRARQARMPITCERQRQLVSAIIDSSCCSPAYRRGRKVVGLKVKCPIAFAPMQRVALWQARSQGRKTEKSDFWGFDHDRAADAKRGMENHLPAFSVHAGEFRGQDCGRP